MYKICVHIIFCFAVVNTYNNVRKIIIFFFKQMLKKNILFVCLFCIWIIGAMLLALQIQKQEDKIFFSYPQWDIYFSGERVPLDEKWYFNRQRFDKEFTISGNNLYQFYLYVKRYPVYIPYIEKKLQQSGIPDDFKYLAIAESALRDDVVSSAGAGGIWQFMPETGKQYGLQVNDFVDERYNFEKSTDAAIEYLSLLYEKFWNWTLAAAAYNRGENAIARALESQQVDNYYDLYLNEETSRYVFRILAIKYLIEWYFEKKSLIDKIVWWVYSIPETQVVQVSEIENLVSWCIENGYNYRDVKVLNPWILGNTLPEGEWNIKVLK